MSFWQSGFCKMCCQLESVSQLHLFLCVCQNGVMSGLMQILLLKVSAHITEQLGMAPGGEFREAFKEVKTLSLLNLH